LRFFILHLWFSSYFQLGSPNIAFVKGESHPRPLFTSVPDRLAGTTIFNLDYLLFRRSRDHAMRHVYCSHAFPPRLLITRTLLFEEHEMTHNLKLSNKLLHQR
jgi:hypothetical protein